MIMSVGGRPENWGLCRSIRTDLLLGRGCEQVLAIEYEERPCKRVIVESREIVGPLLIERGDTLTVTETSTGD